MKRPTNAYLRCVTYIHVSFVFFRSDTGTLAREWKRNAKKTKFDFLKINIVFEFSARAEHIALG
jgi:hypothetical protein